MPVELVPEVPVPFGESPLPEGLVLEDEELLLLEFIEKLLDELLLFEELPLLEEELPLDELPEDELPEDELPAEELPGFELCVLPELLE